MKMVKKMWKFVLLLLLCLSVCKILLPFSLSLSFHQQQSLLVAKLSSMVKSSKLIMFFAFNFILMAILLKYAYKPSKEDFDLISFLAPAAAAAAAAAEYEGEKEKVEDCEDKNKDLVLVLEFVELKENRAQDKNYDGTVSEVDSDDDFHGYDGYDEDNDDDNGGSVDDSYSEDENDDDLNRRIEEFIAKNNRKWEEEQLNEKLVFVYDRS